MYVVLHKVFNFGRSFAYMLCFQMWQNDLQGKKDSTGTYLFNPFGNPVSHTAPPSKPVGRFLQSSSLVDHSSAVSYSTAS